MDTASSSPTAFTLSTTDTQSPGNYIELQLRSKVKWFILFSAMLAMIYCGFFFCDIIIKDFKIPEPFATMTYPVMFVFLNVALATIRHLMGNANLLIYLLTVFYSIASIMYFLIAPEPNLGLQIYDYVFKYTLPFCLAVISYFRCGKRYFSLGVVLLITGSAIFLGARTVEHSLSSFEIIGFAILVVLASILLPILQATLISYGVIALGFVAGLTNSLFLKGLFPGYGTIADFKDMLTAFFWMGISCTLIAFLLVVPKRQQDKLLQEQNKQLQEAFEEIQQRQRLAQEVTEQLSQLVDKLQFTAEQQANGSQEHLSAVNQINTSVLELESAASTIATLAQNVSGAAGQVAGDSERIEKTTGLSVSQSQEGREALGKILTVNQEVSGLYRRLTEAMEDLTGKSASMERVLSVIGNISSETHLLALNAAIEAAGAGLVGERFKVVAHEVKRLSQDTRQASQEVVTIVQEVNGVVREVTEAIAEGNGRVTRLDEVTSSAGRVIERMAEITGESQQQASLINRAAQEMRDATGTISVATEEQRLTVRQIVQALQGLSEIARQNVEGSRVVRSTSGELDQASSKLGQALQKTGKA